ncbi:MAG: DNA-binding response regulator [Omnitrophica bacterium RIFCSPLOWO2_12_FULL_44_17]|uniref:DNA-binding response regulator n=1 Tax=Candidatus Danuiimicrobium aquiferis TaxID=1801832 RepID=A0A1G1KXA6_9BACT|nr:MAG: DNA-binding response regulator [Omnitrophica bacterium RIFCSPHIGHO2_02_FULL_45_28]OGW89824.1 MAG: DNA-binding response regulator [Omnitrophica bacterium RIFCSPHIGHO2_12_FULL_44_12]OGW97452.1 MAG: DNA-binding response regulator [Omnitrophica bacterium RIFCSPLOWO2_12_FULL_44_17]OGX04525.1 MAG: DNA-binding response regulator [Omnitrophica bacterium RIFCSPLOWO2_02_FULL_44_11]
MRILIIEDEEKVARFVKEGLEENNFSVDIAHDGEQGLFLAQNEKYDAIILDLTLPKRDGLDILKTLRTQGHSVPVLCLTARGKLEEKLAGFNAGSDDYLVKPFRFAELLARVRALIKRVYQMVPNTQLKIEDLCLDQLTRKVTRGSREIFLTAKEYAILEYLMLNAGQIVTRTMISETAWDYNFGSMSNVIDVHVKRLREKIDGDEKEKLIHTVRGAGYALKKAEI